MTEWMVVVYLCRVFYSIEKTQTGKAGLTKEVLLQSKSSTLISEQVCRTGSTVVW